MGKWSSGTKLPDQAVFFVLSKMGKRDTGWE